MSIGIDAFLGTIIPWSVNYAPVGWMFCNGDKLMIDQNQRLYSLLMTRYGGDGRVTFGLPDLRGRVIVGAGMGNGLSERLLGQNYGSEKVAFPLLRHSHPIQNFSKDNVSIKLDISNPKINTEMIVESKFLYGVPLSNGDDVSSMPMDSEYYLGLVRFRNGRAFSAYYTSTDRPKVTTKPTPINLSTKLTPSFDVEFPNKFLVNSELSVKGEPDAEISTIQPSLVLNYIICTDGEYPQRR